ncbi:MAG TPA: twin-arginine translocase TatA/TatE family subunit [Acidimicrobiales bacterium]|nr:twin-arginine translocase TatA/TatE family subunit [Acidimicrobiales bacterium]
MLDLSPDKLLMLAVVALVVLGPNRLPGAARTLGRFVAQMRSMSSSLQSEVREALHDPEDAFTSAIAEFRPSQVRRNVRQVVTDTLSPFNPASAPGPSTSPSTTNLPPSSRSAPSPADGAPAAGPPAGWDGRPVPDDPGFN